MSNSNKTLEFPCGKCMKEVFTDSIKCSLCLKWYHRRCTNLSKAQLKHVKMDGQWHCLHCFQIFPFHDIDDDEFFYIT